MSAAPANGSVPAIDPAAAAAQAAALAQLVKALYQLSVVNFSIAACAIWLVYDTLTNIHLEITYIWRTPWSLPKCMYLFARYYGLLHMTISLGVNASTSVSVKFCATWFQFYAYSGPIVFTTLVNIIFILRINAFYGGNKKVLALMIVVILIDFATELYSTIINGFVLKAGPKPFPSWPGCATTGGVSSNSLIAWIPCLLVPLVFFILTMARIIETLNFPHETKDTSLYSRWKSLTPMFALFARDGSIFFALQFGTVLTSTILTQKNPNMPFSNLGLQFLISVYSLTGAKLLLNIRSLKSDNATTIQSTTMPFEMAPYPKRNRRLDQFGIPTTTWSTTVGGEEVSIGQLGAKSESSNETQ